jgi:hypothetical protein
MIPRFDDAVCDYFWIATWQVEQRRRAKSGIYFRSASSRIAASVARPLSVSAYAPLSRLCAMNPQNGHGLHRMVGDADGAVDNAGRDAEQNHVVLRVELRGRLFHGILRSPPPGEQRHAAGSWPCVDARAMRRAAAAALAASGAAALVALAEARGNSFSVMAAPAGA